MMMLRIPNDVALVLAPWDGGAAIVGTNPLNLFFELRSSYLQFGIWLVYYVWINGWLWYCWMFAIVGKNQIDITLWVKR